MRTCEYMSLGIASTAIERAGKNYICPVYTFIFTKSIISIYIVYLSKQCLDDRVWSDKLYQWYLRYWGGSPAFRGWDVQPTCPESSHQTLETSHQTLAASHPSSLFLVDHWVSLGVISHDENSPCELFVSQNSWSLSPYFHRTCQVWVGSLSSSTRPFHEPESTRSREIIGPGLLLWSGQAANSFIGGSFL